MEEKTIVRQNMMDDVNYRAYCMMCRTMPRLGKDFSCPDFKTQGEYEPEFWERYNKKHNLK